MILFHLSNATTNLIPKNYLKKHIKKRTLLMIEEVYFMHKKNTYMDNGATTFPKAPGVAEAMADYLLNNGSNVSRGAYGSALDASRVLYDTREMLCEFFNFDHADHVIFTKNITESINQGLKGFLTKEDHVITSSMEHNAVMRPLNSIGCEISCLPSDEKGYIQSQNLESYIKANTKAIIVTHASNVCGSINDIEAIGKVAKANNIFFMVDAAQTAGVIAIDMKKNNIDFLGFTGHKGLLGPSGIGGFLMEPQWVSKMKPLIEGGTGSASESEYQPEHMPDKYESGTPNVVGIYGLHKSLEFIMNTGVENIYKHEMTLVDYFLKKFKIEKVGLIGQPSTKDRTAVIALDFLDLDNSLVAFKLEKDFHIATRVGMHCAPSAHKSLKTFPQGVVRLSFSYFTSLQDLDYLIESLESVCKTLRE
jgi:cysteine desulfurase family protein